MYFFSWRPEVRIMNSPLLRVTGLFSVYAVNFYSQDWSFGGLATFVTIDLDVEVQVLVTITNLDQFVEKQCLGGIHSPRDS